MFPPRTMTAWGLAKAVEESSDTVSKIHKRIRTVVDAAEVVGFVVKSGSRRSKPLQATEFLNEFMKQLAANRLILLSPLKPLLPDNASLPNAPKQSPPHG
jgi:hypothetical protein